MVKVGCKILEYYRKSYNIKMNTLQIIYNQDLLYETIIHNNIYLLS